MIGILTFKRGICLKMQCAINPFLIHKYVIYLCFSTIRVSVGLKFVFFNLVLRHIYPFSNVKSVRCSPFLFVESCKLNLMFAFVTICAFMSPSMIRTLCFGMLRTREDNSFEKASSPFHH